MTRTVAVIFHENEWHRSLPNFVIWHLAKVWRSEGIKVRFLFGVRQFVPADVALLHVDLTLVPVPYTDFAHRYPIAVNGNLSDIRKSLVSRNRVLPGDRYEGKVIVKSELNYAGQPERKLLGSPFSRLAFRLASRAPVFQPRPKGPGPHFKSPVDYLVYDSPQEVPREWFSRKDLVIEKFTPEMQDGLYCLNNYHFLGNRGVCTRRKSRHPIVNSTTAVSREESQAHPEIVKLTKRMGYDFGKFDYVMHEGKPVLLDANKTPGAKNTPVFRAMCQEWAKGIHDFL